MLWIGFQAEGLRYRAPFNFLIAILRYLICRDIMVSPPLEMDYKELCLYRLSRNREEP
jgi:hypothetical protein